MHKARIKVIASALLISSLISLSTVFASAASIAPNSLGEMNISLDVDGREYKYLTGISNKNAWAYTRPTVSVGSTTASVKGLIINGVYYLPFRAVASAIPGSTYSYDSATRTSTMRAAGLEIVAGDGCYVTYANGRTLFNTTPNVIMSDGRLYIPAAVFAKAVGMRVESSEGKISLLGAYSPLKSADGYYREDEVFWLARIIHAESRGEPLIGQIAVGNVVLNRVSHSDTVAYADGRNKHGSASRHSDSRLYRLGDLVEVCMTGNDLTMRAYNTDKRSFKLLLGVAHGVK